MPETFVRAAHLRAGGTTTPLLHERRRTQHRAPIRLEVGDCVDASTPPRTAFVIAPITLAGQGAWASALALVALQPFAGLRHSACWSSQPFGTEKTMMRFATGPRHVRRQRKPVAPRTPPMPTAIASAGSPLAWQHLSPIYRPLHRATSSLTAADKHGKQCMAGVPMRAFRT